MCLGRERLRPPTLGLAFVSVAIGNLFISSNTIGPPDRNVWRAF
jgi:hypothetical protein